MSIRRRLHLMAATEARPGEPVATSGAYRAPTRLEGALASPPGGNGPRADGSVIYQDQGAFDEANGEVAARNSKALGARRLPGQSAAAGQVPKFGEPITNVTAPVGREAILACLVDDLSTYKNRSLDQRLGSWFLPSEPPPSRRRLFALAPSAPNLKQGLIATLKVTTCVRNAVGRIM
ncbi:Uncharacterized protein GBIM_19158 [Gryllus bimaculatus]|nr:Uncharacterized protein GBIM_19158 [Gryllus bimaculatus]